MYIGLYVGVDSSTRLIMSAFGHGIVFAPYFYCIYNKTNIKIEYDPEKSAQNAVQRELSFALAVQFDFESAHISQDTRRDYGELRYSAIGMIHERLHVLVFKEIPYGIRVISLRKANPREVLRYEKAQT